MHFVVGMILTGLGVWGIIAWWSVFGFVMRGVIPFVLLFLGLIAIIASCRRPAEEGADEALPQPEPDDDLLDPDSGDMFARRTGASTRVS